MKIGIIILGVYILWFYIYKYHNFDLSDFLILKHTVYYAYSSESCIHFSRECCSESETVILCSRDLLPNHRCGSATETVLACKRCNLKYNYQQSN